ncbi:MAG: DUF4130 domain-containing protein [Candidatus Hodarchaeota archaeon]
MKKVHTALIFLSRHDEYFHKKDEYFSRLEEKINIFEDFHLHHATLLKKAQEVENLIHKIKGFIRFISVNELLVGIYKSKHLIMDLIATHFKKRFPLYNTMTFNEDLNSGCLCLAVNDDINKHEFHISKKYSIRPLIAERMYKSPSLLFFQVKNKEIFYDEFLPYIFNKLNPSSPNEDDIDESKRKFETYWNTFYDSQNIESRTNYKYAMKNFTKKQLLKQLGIKSIEAQRVYKKVKKNQKTLYDF